MRNVKIPTHTAAQSLKTCIARVQDKDLKKRLAATEDQVVEASREYVAAAKSVSLHSLKPNNFTLKGVTKKEMTDVYTDRMAKKKAPGRGIYDELILAPAHGICPLCAQRPVSTLDHHLPKAEYWALAVDPLNLVPACADCNKTKLNIAPQTAGAETLHPYFDKVEGDQWLRATVVEGTPVSVTFFVDAPAAWDAVLQQRVKTHFTVFKLATLYACQAADELFNIQFHLAQIYDASTVGGPERVRVHLAEQAESREYAHINSWQTATYQALARSSWYCGGGFR
ncbi:hypothetical protein OG226_17585 [Streptomyces sp. NBC_01261]|uniref:HNH endonuclease n=1 Tax=Streptomyces sp. NBC_01261 TaxID=2903802 RepID=UPI002E325B83|nr:hypothetical protein [Streptomyces sp. NBC_01261]